MPIVVVLLGAVRAVHNDPPYSARRQQGLVDGEIAQVGEEPGSLLVVEGLLDAIVGIVQRLERQSRIFRVTSERIGGK
jgi:hypothetical protein